MGGRPGRSASSLVDAVVRSLVVVWVGSCSVVTFTLSPLRVGTSDTGSWTAGPGWTSDASVVSESDMVAAMRVKPVWKFEVYDR